MTTREMAAFNMGILAAFVLMSITDELAMNTTAWYILKCSPTEFHPITVGEARAGVTCASTGAGIQPLKDFDARMELAKHEWAMIWERTKEKLNLTPN